LQWLTWTPLCAGGIRGWIRDEPAEDFFCMIQIGKISQRITLHAPIAADQQINSTAWEIR
jgi:hypothetical protein